MAFCEKCGSPTAAYKYNDLFLCDDCLFTELGIRMYSTPPHECANCGKILYGDHYNNNYLHYVDDDDNHFCSKECIVAYKLK